MAQFGGQKNPPWATQFTATAVSQPGQISWCRDGAVAAAGPECQPLRSRSCAQGAAACKHICPMTNEPALSVPVKGVGLEQLVWCLCCKCVKLKETWKPKATMSPFLTAVSSVPSPAWGTP
uniref:Uncharacterized protein n=1 Tax=Zonotrichia albicollis TaxID=44394 RepID=A0A8D2N615_ZONAL